MALNRLQDAPQAQGSDAEASTVVNLVETDSTPGGVQLVNPYRTNKVDCMDLVELAQEIQKADKFVHANVSNKLQVIAEQVRFLQDQARRVLEEAKENADLHHVPCNLVKKPGTIYHLYRRSSGQRYLSLLSPQEWGSTCPHEFLGSYRLEHDHSWTPEHKMEARSNDQQMINKILTCSNTLSITMGDK
ncbi:uncharacterized protein C1orf50 homolog isoform X1 [Penaeus vannamei]|uniref:uncharacterized protein C1orf50 homolog isoform X1 n=1 Tax=Penaeus vannamei TaxID=6689 RepID=UPI000F6657E9|nr:uncharacterized protein C1orf50 homolog isoform X1 [Penaeus vannamei]